MECFVFFAVLSFMLGGYAGSFLNVCFWRIPRGESILWPGSHCPKCNAPIRWFQNIPVFSWIALRGRCAGCHEPISPRYLIVELVGGAIFLSVYLLWAVPIFFPG